MRAVADAVGAAGRADGNRHRRAGARWSASIVDRSHPRPIVGFGFSMLAIALTWLSVEMTPTTPIWRLVLPLTAMGVGMAFIWSPLAATATRNLPSRSGRRGIGCVQHHPPGGLGAGQREHGGVHDTRIGAEMPPAADGPPRGEGAVTAAAGASCTNRSRPRCRSRCCCLRSSRCSVWWRRCSCSASAGAGRRRDAARSAPTDEPTTRRRRHRRDFGDDDEYVEISPWRTTRARCRAPTPSGSTRTTTRSPSWRRCTRGTTDAGRCRCLAAAPRRDTRNRMALSPAEPVRSLFELRCADCDRPRRQPSVAEPIGFAHNGFHVDEEQRFQPLTSPATRITQAPTTAGVDSRRATGMLDDEPSVQRQAFARRTRRCIALRQALPASD